MTPDEYLDAIDTADGLVTVLARQVATRYGASTTTIFSTQGVRGDWIANTQVHPAVRNVIYDPEEWERLAVLRLDQHDARDEFYRDLGYE